MAAEPRCRRWPHVHALKWHRVDGIDVCVCSRCHIPQSAYVPPRNLDALQSHVTRKPDPDFPGCTS